MLKEEEDGRCHTQVTSTRALKMICSDLCSISLSFPNLPVKVGSEDSATQEGLA